MSSGPVGPPFRPRRQATHSILNLKPRGCLLSPFALAFISEMPWWDVGSTERMNYTVLGNSVNLAARLEGLNKGYGTTILVSEAVRERVERSFRFKSIASVTAKGMTTETRVYELVKAVA